MLVLTRKTNEQLVIQLGDDTVYVRVLSIGRDRVRIGVIAPRNITVHREEVAQRIREWEQEGVFAEVVSRIADVLQANSAHNSNRQVVRLYERWVKTGSAPLAVALAGRGLTPQRGHGGIH